MSTSLSGIGSGRSKNASDQCQMLGSVADNNDRSSLYFHGNSKAEKLTHKWCEIFQVLVITLPFRRFRMY